MKHKALIGITAAAAILSTGAGLEAQDQNAPKTMTGTLDPAKVKFDISPTMYGVFFEDINFAADGGLYAELIKNRSFEFPNGLSGWETDGKVQVVKGSEGDVPFPRNPHFARLTAESHRDQWTALDNAGFRGLAFEKDKTYHLTLMARLAPGTTEPVRFDAAFVREDGTMEARTPFTVNSREWKEYKVDVKAVSTQTRGKFRLLLNGHRGTVDMDHISLFPEDTWKGRANGLRNDLAQAIADLKPKIFRFPGGCIIEGTKLEDRYQWKNSVGPVGNRPLNGNRWNNTFVDHLTPDYFQSYGLGFFEFFEFCEDIGAEPLPVLNIGLACQFQNDANDRTAQVALDQLGPYIQDCLDLIEFANGPVTSTWGKVRADMGHPEPFNLKYMGIGNEQWGKLYTDRLPIFLREIRAKYPEIRIIGSSGPNPDGADFDY
ncbi:MAG: alpha-L-arabinofuranosidase, partial [Lentisphaeria bacterium]|nr:alpha-L-arabinofuranosidase [Lentisphaeria bacterium]